MAYDVNGTPKGRTLGKIRLGCLECNNNIRKDFNEQLRLRLDLHEDYRPGNRNENSQVYKYLTAWSGTLPERPPVVQILKSFPIFCEI
jgi:hypothetical protein